MQHRSAEGSFWGGGLVLELAKVNGITPARLSISCWLISQCMASATRQG
jgi:hypothetical protein